MNAETKRKMSREAMAWKTRKMKGYGLYEKEKGEIKRKIRLEKEPEEEFR